MTPAWKSRANVLISRVGISSKFEGLRFRRKYKSKNFGPRYAITKPCSYHLPNSNGLAFENGCGGSMWGAFPSNRKMKTILIEVPYE
jgi:hypothetical protein